jgi:hypothetical protein
MECEWTKAVWFMSPLGVNFNRSDKHHISFINWLEQNVKQQDNYTLQMVFAKCYQIWTLRNKRWFDGITLPKVRTVNKKAMDSIFLLNRNLAPISLSRSAVRWVPPISGHYKLNIDVASPMEDGNWVLAAIVRDSGWWWLLVAGINQLFRT